MIVNPPTLQTKFFIDKNVLIISPEPWDHLFVSKHHYAIELSEKNKVYFLNPAGTRFDCRRTRYHNLWEVDYPAFIPGLRYLPSFIQRHVSKTKFAAIEAMTKVKFDCVWSFDNSVFFDFSFLPSRVLAISHIVDYAQNFQLKKAASTAHFCMAVSPNIADLLRPHNPHTFLMPHGIALDHTPVPDVGLPGTNKVKAIFAGNLDRKHFDKEMLLRLAASHPEVDFIFFGPGGKDWSRLSNTFYPGVVDSDVLLNYLEKADVLLLPYRFEGFPKELTNSHKVLDYLRSGKVIVSSYLDDYADKQHLVQMARNLTEFSQVFTDVINNLPSHNNAVNVAMRKKYAAQHSYKTRLEDIERIIERVHREKFL